jgi:hypothetical protein
MVEQAAYNGIDFAISPLFLRTPAPSCPWSPSFLLYSPLRRKINSQRNSRPKKKDQKVEGELDSREEEIFDGRSQMAGQVRRSEIAVSQVMISLTDYRR